MTGVKITIGEVTTRIADTISLLRTEHGLTYTDLSKLLHGAGRPLNPVSLRALEQHRRRIDIDDLYAFAQVFGITPADLLESDAAEAHREKCLRWLLAETDHRRTNRTTQEDQQ